MKIVDSFLNFSGLYFAFFYINGYKRNRLGINLEETVLDGSQWRRRPRLTDSHVCGRPLVSSHSCRTSSPPCHGTPTVRMDRDQVDGIDICFCNLVRSLCVLITFTTYQHTSCATCSNGNESDAAFSSIYYDIVDDNALFFCIY